MDEYATEAHALGMDAGKNAASWFVGSSADQETYEAILKGLDDGDPEVLNMAPAWLSGEWADEPVPMDIVEVVGYAPSTPYVADDATVQDILDAYESGADEAFWNEVARVCAYHLEGEK